MRARIQMLCRMGLACLVGLVGGCLADPELPPDYADDIGMGVVPPIDPTPVPEPNPFQPGDARLAVGLFYEGGRSETIPINGSTTNYFIFEESFQQSTSLDRMEGQTSDKITLNGTPFWGSGIIWDVPIDLSDWTTMYVGFRSSDPSFATFELTLQSGGGDPPAGATVAPTSYGYTNDGEWHFLEIPLQDFIDRGFDPSAVRSPFIIAAPGGTAGDQMLIDNLYFTDD